MRVHSTIKCAMGADVLDRVKNLHAFDIQLDWDDCKLNTDTRRGIDRFVHAQTIFDIVVKYSQLNGRVMLLSVFVDPLD